MLKKSKIQLYREMEKLVNADIKKEYLKYCRTFYKTEKLSTERALAIQARAYKRYKKKEHELEDRLDSAYLDLMQ